MSGHRTDRAGLAEVAQWLARLLLRELDAQELARLRGPELRAALAPFGLVPPEGADVDELAAEYFEAWVRPASGAPPVQSLWTAGNHEADCAVALRRLAAAAGLELDRTAARGAPVDHLGSILALWAEAARCAPEVARRIEAEHLEWAHAPLRRAEGGDGYYARVAGAVRELLRALGAAPVAQGTEEAHRSPAP